MDVDRDEVAQEAAADRAAQVVMDPDAAAVDAANCRITDSWPTTVRRCFACRGLLFA